MPKSTDAPRIHSLFPTRLLDYVRGAGGDAEALRRRFSLPEPTGALRGLDVPPETVRRLAEAAEAMLGDPCMGLNMAIALPRGGYDVFEFAVRSAPTLSSALERLVRYSVTVTPRAIFVLSAQPGGSVLSYRIPGDPAALGRHGNEFTLAVIVRFCRQLVGDAWAPERVCFAHPAPADRAAIERFFGAPVLTFDCPESSLFFDREVLETPLLTADPALLPILDRYAEALLPPPSSESTILDHLRHSLRHSFTEGPPTIDAAAAALKMSPRTLQRRLSALGTSFAEVLDEMRRNLAHQYLDDPKLSLGEIAFLLGYSEVGAFVRAFKGWTGTTPGRYRSQGR